MISVRLQGKQFNITVIQVYVPTINAEEAEVEWFYDDLEDLLELTPKKRCPFHYRRLECKSRNQETPAVTGEFGLGIQNEAGQRLITAFPREHTGHSKHSFPTTKENTQHMDIIR